MLPQAAISGLLRRWWILWLERARLRCGAGGCGHKHPLLGCPRRGKSAFSGTVSSTRMSSQAVVPVQVLQSLYDSVLEWENKPNKTKLGSVIDWLQFSVSWLNKTIPASGINKLASCLANLSSCSLIRCKVLSEFISSECFAFHSAQ